ncbi:LptM family lipoprotein [Ruminococcus albus]|uniref:DUF4829 domain-containing protein n=1 Tax=Ruminococcus albus TaxID=1264 RepID=A0A1H7K791_RUMAL|nr:hypothetical protein [Ruminococcus albus]SEK81797.1 hypothetical protein SAMN05216469_10660 [Ruminococcus albus]
MKKLVLIAVAAAMAFTLTGCGKNAVEASVISEKYTEEETSAAVEEIVNTYELNGKQTDSVRYLGDEVCTDEVIDKLIEMGMFEKECGVEDCMGFEVDYHFSRKPIVAIRAIMGGKFDFDEHENVQVWLIKQPEDGKWIISTTGIDVI